MRLLLIAAIAAHAWAARNFDGASGSLSNATAIQPAAVTICAWVYPETFGEGSLGRIFDNTVFLLNTRGAATSVQAAVNTSGTARVTNANTAISLNAWSYWCMSYTASDGGPRIYYGTTSASVTEASYDSRTDGTGTNVAAGSAYIGNRSTDDRTLDGSVAELKVWSRVLTTTQMEQAKKGYPVPSPVACPQLYGAVSPEPDPCLGGTWTVTSAIAASHAPVAPSFSWWAKLRDWLLPIPAFIGGFR